MARGRRLTTEEIIERFKKVHGDRYNYDKVKYNHLHEKVIIICNRHGEFEQTPKNHLRGQNCRKCYLEDTNGKFMKEPKWRKWASNNMKRSSDKLKEGMIKKYGVEYATQSNIIKEKTRKFFLEKYGVDNPFQIDVDSRIKKARETNIKKGNWISDEDLRPFLLYKKKVWYHTNKSILKYNASWLLEGRSRTGNHLDHIYSIHDGFKNNIDPKIIGHILNLQILDAKLNRSKGIDSWICINELKSGIIELDNINNEKEK